MTDMRPAKSLRNKDSRAPTRGAVYKFPTVRYATMAELRGLYPLQVVQPCSGGPNCRLSTHYRLKRAQIGIGSRAQSQASPPSPRFELAGKGWGGGKNRAQYGQCTSSLSFFTKNCVAHG